MSLADIVILGAVAALLVLAVRSIARESKEGCSECGGSCSAAEKGGHCTAAARMLAHADAALKKR